MKSSDGPTVGTGGRGNRPHRSVRLSGLVDVGRLNDTLRVTDEMRGEESG